MAKEFTAPSGVACAGEHDWERIPSEGISEIYRYQCTKCNWWGWRPIRDKKSMVRVYKNGIPPDEKVAPELTVNFSSRARNRNQPDSFDPSSNQDESDPDNREH